MKRVEYLEKKGIKSVEDMDEEQFYCFTQNVLTLGKMHQHFMLTGHPWCIFDAYNVETGEKAEFYITREVLKAILS